MLTERQVLSKIEILEDSQIQIRENTIIERDGIEISRVYHRRVLEPSDTHTETEPRLVAIISVIWTREVIDEYERKKTERENSLRI